MCWSRDGSKIVCCDRNNTLYLVDVKSGKQARHRFSGKNDINDLIFDQTGQFLLMATGNGGCCYF